MTETELRQEIVAVAQAIDRAGFCPSKSGNVSARFGDGLLITPSGLPYAQTKPEDLIHLGLDGTVLGGNRKPVSYTHLDVYKRQAVDVASVIAVLHDNADKAQRLVARLAADFPAQREACPAGSHNALDNAIVTAPAFRDPALLAKLDAVAGRVLKAA